MRVNVYAEEMTDRIEIISKTIDGHTFTGLRLYLELPVTLPDGTNFAGPFMHRPGDDDSAAVTFWGKRDLRDVLRKMLIQLDAHYAGVKPFDPNDPLDRDIANNTFPDSIGDERYFERRAAREKELNTLRAAAAAHRPRQETRGADGA